jgi:hypothetical protein
VQRLRRERRGVETAGVSHDAPATTERDSMILLVSLIANVILCAYIVYLKIWDVYTARKIKEVGEILSGLKINMEKHTDFMKSISGKEDQK